MLRTFTDPPIAGLMVHAVSRPGQTEGVTAVYVPRSEGGPHRAVGATTETNDRYYMRTAAGAQTIPHALLAAMFGRVPPPQLEIHVSRDELQTYTFRVVNVGRGVAHKVFFRLIARGMPGLLAAPMNRSFEESDWRQLFRVNRHRVTTYNAAFAGLLYPDDETRIATIHYQGAPAVMHFTARVDAEGCRAVRESDSGPVVVGPELKKLGDDGNPALAL